MMDQENADYDVFRKMEKSRRSSILKAISSNVPIDDKVNRKKDSKRISFSNNLLYQEMLADGTTRVFHEINKKVTEEIFSPVNKQNSSEIFNDEDDDNSKVLESRKFKKMKFLPKAIAKTYDIKDGEDKNTIINTFANRYNFDVSCHDIEQEVIKFFKNQSMEVTTMEQDPPSSQSSDYNEITIETEEVGEHFFETSKVFSEQDMDITLDEQSMEASIFEETFLESNNSNHSNTSKGTKTEPRVDLIPQLSLPQEPQKNNLINKNNLKPESFLFGNAYKFHENNSNLFSNSTIKKPSLLVTLKKPCKFLNTWSNQSTKDSTALEETCVVLSSQESETNEFKYYDEAKKDDILISQIDIDTTLNKFTNLQPSVTNLSVVKTNDFVLDKENIPFLDQEIYNLKQSQLHSKTTNTSYSPIITDEELREKKFLERCTQKTSEPLIPSQKVTSSNLNQSFHVSCTCTTNLNPTNENTLPNESSKQSLLCVLDSSLKESELISKKSMSPVNVKLSINFSQPSQDIRSNLSKLQTSICQVNEGLSLPLKEKNFKDKKLSNEKLDFNETFTKYSQSENILIPNFNNSKENNEQNESFSKLNTDLKSNQVSIQAATTTERFNTNSKVINTSFNIKSDLVKKHKSTCIIVQDKQNAPSTEFEDNRNEIEIVKKPEIGTTFIKFQNYFSSDLKEPFFADEPNNEPNNKPNDKPNDEPIYQLNDKLSNKPNDESKTSFFHNENQVELFNIKKNLNVTFNKSSTSTHFLTLESFLLEEGTSVSKRYSKKYDHKQDNDFSIFDSDVNINLNKSLSPSLTTIEPTRENVEKNSSISKPTEDQVDYLLNESCAKRLCTEAAFVTSKNASIAKADNNFEPSSAQFDKKADDFSLFLNNCTIWEPTAETDSKSTSGTQDPYSQSPDIDPDLDFNILNDSVFQFQENDSISSYHSLNENQVSLSSFSTSSNSESENSVSHLTFHNNRNSLCIMAKELESNMASFTLGELAGDISKFIDNEALSPRKVFSREDVGSFADKCLTIDDAGAVFSFLCGCFNLIVDFADYDEATGAIFVSNVRLVCKIHELLQGKKYINIKENSFELMWADKHPKIICILKRIIFGWIQKLESKLAENADNKYELIHLLNDVSNIFEKVSGLMIELRHLSNFNNGLLLKFDNDYYEFAFEIPGIRHTISLIIPIDIKKYPQEPIKPKFGINKEDRKFYNLDIFSRALQKEKPGNYTYLRRLVLSSKTFIRFWKKYLKSLVQSNIQ